MLTPSLLSRLVLADLRRSPVVALVLTCLTGLVVCLAGASVLLMGRTMAATDQLWQADVVQMSAGPISAQDVAAIHDWAAQREDVAEAQISRTLPVPVAALSINGTSQASSVLEPAFVTQNPSFDLLVGEDGQVLQPGPGEIALPVHYLVTGEARIGDTVEVHSGEQTITLTVVAFARDAQMNPSLVTSKRLLVSPADYERLDAMLGDEEQIIELRTVAGADAGQVLDAYTDSGLPARGVAVDSSAMRLMNGLSTYLVAAVALAIALLVLGVVALAVRLAVLAGVRADLPQLAALRALGLPRSSLAAMILAKHVTLALVGAVIGLAVCAPLADALGATSLVYLGRPSTSLLMVLSAVGAGVAVLVLVVGGALVALRRELGRPVMTMLRVADGAGSTPGGSGSRRRGPRHRRGTGLLRTLARAPRISPVTWLGARTAVSGQGALLAGVITVATVLMVLPLGVLTTLGDARFSTYLGVGENVELRVDVRQGAADADSLIAELRQDPRVSQIEVRGAERPRSLGHRPRRRRHRAALPAAVHQRPGASGPRGDLPVRQPGRGPPREEGRRGPHGLAGQLRHWGGDGGRCRGAALDTGGYLLGRHQRRLHRFRPQGGADRAPVARHQPASVRRRQRHRAGCPAAPRLPGRQGVGARGVRGPDRGCDHHPDAQSRPGRLRGGPGRGPAGDGPVHGAAPGALPS